MYLLHIMITSQPADIRSPEKITWPSKSNAYLTEVNTGDGQENSSRATVVVTYYCAKYYIILDAVITNLKQRFSKESMALAKNVNVFLMFDYSKIIINHYKVNK